MRTANALLTTAVALLAVGCGSDPPTYCGDAIPQQEVFVGEQQTIDACFDDPGGGELTLSATSSDESVARAFLLRDKVGIAGVSPGEASVTIEATNEDDLSADVSFTVRVPNRAPEFTSDMTEATVILNRSLEWNLMEMFVEHDREEMTFDASSSNNGVVGVSVDGSVAEVTGLSDGVSQVTLTAKDPHDAEGTGTIEVTVKTPVRVLEDDFETERSLDDWEIHDSLDASVQDGILRLRMRWEGFWGWMLQEVDEVTDFIIEVTMAPGEGTYCGPVWYTGSENGTPRYHFLVGTFTEDRNWLVIDDNQDVVVGGNSDRIELDELLQYVISLSGSNLVISVGAEEIFNGTLDNAPPTMVAVGLAGTNVASEYDDVAVLGVRSSSRNANAPKVERPIELQKMAFPELDLVVKR